MNAMALSALLLFSAANSVGASRAVATENPIRKVVRLMQDMSAEIEKEKKKEAALFEKFMCICNEYPSELEATIDSTGKTIAQLTSKIEEETALKAKLAEELKGHAADKDGAEKDLAKATTLREKETSEYEESASGLKGSIGQLDSAIPALEKGAGAAALMQAEGSNHLKNVIESSSMITEFDKKQVLSFLSAGSDSSSEDSPQSGQVLGILKQMKDDMEKSLSDADTAEKVAASGFSDLKGAKDQEIEIASEAIEGKEKRVGELAVSIAQSSDGLEDAQDEEGDAKKMLNTLTTTCDSKKKAFEERLKLRDGEVAAISEAITILNDDDALDVFKKAVPSALAQEPVSGFLQTKHASTSMMNLKQAVEIIKQASAAHHDVHLELLLSKMTTKLRSANKHADQQAPDFSSVVKMIDGMIGVLTREQDEDAKKKEWCNAELAKGEKDLASKQETMDSVSASISEASDEVAGVADEIAALEKGIADMNREVALATEQRKAEHSEYLETLQLTEAAVQLLGKAKNRLNKFYNPTIYKAAPKKEMSMEEKIIGSYSFVQRHSAAHGSKKQMPDIPDLPKYKQQNSGGVIALMDSIVTDLSKDKVGAEHDEKAAQADYVKLMAESQDTLAQDGKSLVNKKSAKAELEQGLVAAKASKKVTYEELSNAHTFLGELHSSCDFVVENFSMREQARSAELESLNSAKAVMSGAK